ncbi:dnaJ homolog subfamily C member 12 [Polyodon spathula]|uniref:dnaJ homolog subfamily C member 12 n=1 Tax=Polyodon spathula TaxID=7913 RepID=UPI001B7E6A30|nr:dnaJ homolog subfamily C member 12 [Polyodon spathula]
MDAILNCRPEDLEDYYGLLGCDELSSSEQILTEFKARALDCHPDKHPDNPKAVAEFQKLQQAKEILKNEDSRARYDYWRRSRIAIPFRDWEALSDTVKASMHWAVKSKKEPMLEAPGIKDSLSPGNPPDRHGEQDCNSLTSKMEQVGLSGGKTTEKTAEDEEPQSPKTPPSPNENYWHLRFRWSADTPSELLRKFRNYEI